ncbi:MAG: alpha/beta hydrolase [Blautia sp.]|nr:alpha/beta hydrolase [Blautia sp.]
MGNMEGVLSLRDTTVDYMAFGKGQRPLILIQGLTFREFKGSVLLVSHMYRIFSRDYRVYLFDRIRDLPEDYTVEQMAGDLAACMDQLGLSQADVVGVSQGGMIGQYLALDRPDLVRKLVLAVTTSRSNELIQTAIEKWTAFARADDYQSLVMDMLDRCYSENYQKKFRRVFPILLKTVNLLPAERFANMAKACLTCGTYERLEEITCPVFIIGGEKDLVVGPQASREMAEKLNCGIYMYEEYGHSAYEEAKDFNQRVYDFLGGIV